MQRQITGLQSLDKSPERPQNIKTNEEQNKENLQPDDHHCNQPKNQKVEVIPVQISEVDLNSGDVLFDSSLHSLDLTKLLNESIFGKVTLSIYEIRKDFDESTRRKLVDLIITSLLSKTDPLNQPIQYKNHHFDELANKIIGLFPSETKEIYYVAPHTEGSQQKISKGKLVDAYRNRLRQLKKAGLHRGRKRKIEETEGESDSIDTENKRVCTVHQDWLRHNTAPWESVVEHWNASRALRQSDFHKAIGNVNSIIEAWPVVKQPLGYTLLESDYNYMFNDGLSIYSEWPMLSTKLENLMRSEIKEKAYIPFLDNLKDSDITPDSRDAILLSLLPVICPPSTVVRLAKGSWKPSCAESINGFILHVKVPGDLEMARDQQREKMAKIKQPLQPYVIVLGPRLSAIEHSYVNVDETLYLVESPLKAVDICYKIFQVLNATYPPQSEQVWLFLQKYVYKRTTRWDKQVKSVIILTGKLNQAKKENSRSGEPESQN
ncbi:uncharacterized protein LOC125501699 [Athalia rosae]|uniref:uncharacterized protein LOC125501699 n=1 Tax=Athalia rosae TaxID=37344 RepID=UPI0020345219|nr:uncharacterized protein LOC125501699 [Athalia rosae]